MTSCWADHSLMYQTDHLLVVYCRILNRQLEALHQTMKRTSWSNVSGKCDFARVRLVTIGVKYEILVGNGGESNRLSGVIVCHHQPHVSVLNILRRVQALPEMATVHVDIYSFLVSSLVTVVLIVRFIWTACAVIEMSHFADFCCFCMQWIFVLQRFSDDGPSIVGARISLNCFLAFTY